MIAYFFGFSVLFWMSFGKLPLTVSDVLLVCLLPKAFGAMRSRWSSCPRRLPWGTFFLTLSLCSGTVACLASGGMKGGVLKACQLAWYLMIAPLVISYLPEERVKILKGLAVGFAANVLVAFCQGAWLRGGVCGGLMGSRVGLGVGLALAVCLLLQREGLPMRWVTAPVGSIALMVYGLVLNSVSGIVLGALAIVIGYRNQFVIRERQLHVAPFLVMALLVILVSPVRRAVLVDCVTPTEKTALVSESPRRWVQERICAFRAMKAAPWLGYGPGKYQSTVGTASFRGSFPRPNETKVELNTQDGWQVIGVEYGVVTALSLMFGWLVMWFSSRMLFRNAMSRGTDIGKAFLIMIPGMFFTPMLVKGAGMLLALVVGMFWGAVSPTDVAHEVPGTESGGGAFSRKGVWEYMVLIPWIIVLYGMIYVNQHGFLSRSKADPEAHEGLAAGTFVQMLEAESLETVQAPYRNVEDSTCSGGALVEIEDHALEGHDEWRSVGLKGTLTLERETTVRLWLRARWKDGCGNSVFISWNGGPSLLAGNDGTYQAWHWVNAGDFVAPAGTVEFQILPSEDGLELDQILICEDRHFYPSGVFGQPSENPSKPSGVMQALPAEKPAGRPLRIGVCGPYRGGYEAMLTQLGIPFIKLMEWELESAERLEACDVVLVSEPTNVNREVVEEALLAFARNGGVLVMEQFAKMMDTLGEYSELFPTMQRSSKRYYRGGRLTADDSWLFEGIEPGTTFQLAPDVSIMRVLLPVDPAWKSFGIVSNFDRMNGGCMYERQVGKGRLIYCCAPLSYHTMWRGDELWPLLENLIRHLAADFGRQPLWGGWKTSHAAPAEPCLKDDFMRSEGEESAGGLTVKSGTFRCVGDQSAIPHGNFSLECVQAGEVAYGNGSWRGYRAACSAWGKGCLSLKGATSSGRVVTAQLDVTTGALDVKLGLEPEQKPLHTETGVMRSGDGVSAALGWRRLGMLCRDGQCEVYVDGMLAQVLPVAADEVLAGAVQFGLTQPGMLLDDVSIRNVSDIPKGTDRAVGEEGSCLSMERMADGGIEPSTVFSPYAMLSPVSESQNACELPLGRPQDGVLWVDGKGYMLGNHEPSGRVVLPVTDKPLSEVYVETGRWLDYVFKNRLTDWEGDDGWQNLQRWSCDQNWSWLGVEAVAPSVLWHKRSFQAPYAIRAFMSVGAREALGSDYFRGHDLNLVLGGDGVSSDSGWSVRVMEAEWKGIELWHGDTLVAREETYGLPAGHALHHNWFEVTAKVDKGRIRVYYEGQLVMDQPVDEKTLEGRIGIWTEKNSIRVGRAQIAF